jgi:hypothetical protein
MKYKEIRMELHSFIRIKQITNSTYMKKQILLHDHFTIYYVITLHYITSFYYVLLFV